MAVARGNIQQLSFILWTEQYSPFGLMLLCLRNVLSHNYVNCITELLLREGLKAFGWMLLSN